MAKKKHVDYNTMPLEELDKKFANNNKIAIAAMFVLIGVLFTCVGAVGFFYYGMVVPKIISYVLMGVGSLADVVLIAKGKKDYKAIIKEYDRRGLLEDDKKHAKTPEARIEKVKLSEENKRETGSATIQTGKGDETSSDEQEKQ